MLFFCNVLSVFLYICALLLPSNSILRNLTQTHSFSLHCLLLIIIHSGPLLLNRIYPYSPYSLSFVSLFAVLFAIHHSANYQFTFWQAWQGGSSPCYSMLTRGKLNIGLYQYRNIMPRGYPKHLLYLYPLFKAW